jgi:hypothetical protein
MLKIPAVSSRIDPTVDSILISDTESDEDDENESDGSHDGVSSHENTVHGTTSPTPERSARIGRDIRLDEVSRSPASIRTARTRPAMCVPVAKVVTRNTGAQTELISLGNDELHGE